MCVYVLEVKDILLDQIYSRELRAQWDIFKILSFRKYLISALCCFERVLTRRFSEHALQGLPLLRTIMPRKKLICASCNSWSYTIVLYVIHTCLDRTPTTNNNKQSHSAKT